jgi:hypothetical protein
MAEGMVVMALLTAFWAALGWIGRAQDIALSAQHASGFAASLATRTLHPASDQRAMLAASAAYLRGPAHQWLSPGGHSMLHEGASFAGAGELPRVTGPAVSLRMTQDDALMQASDAGGDAAMLSMMRADWRGSQAGLAIAHAYVPVGMMPFEHGIALPLARQISVLRDAGHADSDVASQQTLADARHAWRQAAVRSTGAGRRVARVMAPVDSGWRRPAPHFNWTSRWAGEVPAAVLRAKPASAHSGPRRIQTDRGARHGGRHG